MLDKFNKAYLRIISEQADENRNIVLEKGKTYKFVTDENYIEELANSAQEFELIPDDVDVEEMEEKDLFDAAIKFVNSELEDCPFVSVETTNSWNDDYMGGASTLIFSIKGNGNTVEDLMNSLPETSVLYNHLDSYLTGDESCRFE